MKEDVKKMKKNVREEREIQIGSWEKNRKYEMQETGNKMKEDIKRNTTKKETVMNFEIIKKNVKKKEIQNGQKNNRKSERVEK